MKYNPNPELSYEEMADLALAINEAAELLTGGKLREAVIVVGDAGKDNEVELSFIVIDGSENRQKSDEPSLAFITYTEDDLRMGMPLFYEGSIIREAAELARDYGRKLARLRRQIAEYRDKLNELDEE